MAKDLKELLSLMKNPAVLQSQMDSGTDWTNNMSSLSLGDSDTLVDSDSSQRSPILPPTLIEERVRVVERNFSIYSDDSSTQTSDCEDGTLCSAKRETTRKTFRKILPLPKKLSPLSQGPIGRTAPVRFQGAQTTTDAEGGETDGGGKDDKATIDRDDAPKEGETKKRRKGNETET